ncbi:MAG TPA: tetratricopeptide repeat protein [Verrucomicrobiae bacterium]|nr:tetratricopeptide repeat protein [Verrucomicrobiae bacterium]
MPPSRRWAFRLIALLLVPLLALGSVEVVLRAVGFGYPTSFFLEQKIAGQPFRIENDQFGLKFFPPQLARSPAPIKMAVPKKPGTFRIFIFGESAALGDPEPAFGFGRFLKVLLKEQFPEKRFEVICTAMTAINSHAIVPIARECAQYQGDLWIIYMGNNEFVGPFGPSTVFGPQVPPLSLIRLNLALKSTRIGQFIYKLASARPKQNNWGGMKMFLDNQVGPADPRKEKVYEYLRDNLEDILAAAQSSGARVLLTTVSANLKDCPPFASQHSKSLSTEAQKKWETIYESGVRAQDGQDFPQAISNYEAAAQMDSTFAELQFRWAQCLLSITNFAEARRHFELARDCDSLPFRADTRINETIQQVADKNSARGLRFIDAATVLASESPARITGKEFMHEHVHLNFEGNYRIALAIAPQVAALVQGATNRGEHVEWASFEKCAERLALTDWDRRRVYESLLRRLAEPPFVGQSGHAAQMESLRESVQSARSRLTAEALQKARSVYQAAVADEPGDLYLRADFAKLLEDTGNLSGAAHEWQTLRDEIPFAPAPHYFLGRVLGREGETDKALAELKSALAIRPDLAEAWAEQGRILTKAQRADEALASFDKASVLEPGNPRILMDRAEALAAKGRHAEALESLRRAAALQPGSWEVHYLLGVELALSSQVGPAADQFSQVVRLNPNYSLGHLNLGIALAKLERIDEAMAQFQETLRLDPNNDKAAQYFQALKTAGRGKQEPKR